MTAAVIVSLWYKGRADFHSFSTKGQFELPNCPPDCPSNLSTNGPSDLDKVNIDSTFWHPVLIYRILKVCLLWQLLRARQRLRYLRLVCPPTLVELRKSRRERRRDAVLLKTIRCVLLTPVWLHLLECHFHSFSSMLFRDLFFCGSMLLLMLCIIQNNSLTDQHHLGNVIRKQFVR